MYLSLFVRHCQLSLQIGLSLASYGSSYFPSPSPTVGSVMFVHVMDRNGIFLFSSEIRPPSSPPPPHQQIMPNIFTSDYWLFESPAHNLSAFLGLFVFFLLTCMNYLYILDNNLLKLKCVVNIGTSFVNFRAEKKNLCFY